MRLEHASGSSAPSMTFPTPSMILYVGSCFPSVETELKKWGLGVIGDCEVGNRPWPSGKERGVVVHNPLRNMRERANEGRVLMARIIWGAKPWQRAQQGTAVIPVRSDRSQFEMKSDLHRIAIRTLLLRYLMRIRKFVFAAFSAAFPISIQDERPYLMCFMNQPLPPSPFLSFLPPGSPRPPPRGLSSRPRFRPAWLCSFPF
jgi:hypothetical protein